MRTESGRPRSSLLFLSMLPLHADAPDRQDALLANAMRLFFELEGDVDPEGADA